MCVSRFCPSRHSRVPLACQPAAPDPRGVDRGETLLTVSATGRAETRPDEARFMVGVNTLAGFGGRGEPPQQ